MSTSQNSEVRWASLASVTLAGAWTLFHIIWNLNHQTGDDYWGAALLVLFLLTLMLALTQYFPERSRLRASSSSEQFPEPPITKFFFASTGAAAMWFIIRMDVGAEWLLAGWAKITSPAWGVKGIALKGFVAGALAKTTGPNPAVQGWYAWFLQHIVLPYTGFFSFLVSWGELLVGLGVLLGGLTGIAAGFGVLMNLNYLLAGTVSVNPILGMFGLFLCFSWRVCGWLGLDRVLLPRIGLPWKPGPWLTLRDLRELTRTGPIRRPV
jgi:thiosulfate dehydrogenase [quinone] large subunit